MSNPGGLVIKLVKPVLYTRSGIFFYLNDSSNEAE